MFYSRKDIFYDFGLTLEIIHGYLFRGWPEFMGACTRLAVLSKLDFNVWPGELFSLLVVILCTSSCLGNSGN